jgi:hypothetical protein
MRPKWTAANENAAVAPPPSSSFLPAQPGGMLDFVGTGPAPKGKKEATRRFSSRPSV